MSVGGGSSDRLHDKMEQVFQQISQLEDQQAANRKRRHQLAADAHHNHSLAPQLPLLDRQYDELGKEHAVATKMRQQILRQQESRIQRSLRRGAKF